jgi:hypothetical protein
LKQDVPIGGAKIAFTVKLSERLVKVCAHMPLREVYR